MNEDVNNVMDPNQKPSFIKRIKFKATEMKLKTFFKVMAFIYFILYLCMIIFYVLINIKIANELKVNNS